MDVMPGIASSYIFTLKPGDKVIMSGPYGDFHPIFDSNKEMMWIGGGAGMAPLRAQIMHLSLIHISFHSQLTVIPEGDDVHEMFGWIMPRFNQFSANHSYFS